MLKKINRFLDNRIRMQDAYIGITVSAIIVICYLFKNLPYIVPKVFFTPLVLIISTIFTIDTFVSKSIAKKAENMKWFGTDSGAKIKHLTNLLNDLLDLNTNRLAFVAKIVAITIEIFLYIAWIFYFYIFRDIELISNVTNILSDICAAISLINSIVKAHSNYRISICINTSIVLIGSGFLTIGIPYNAII